MWPRSARTQPPNAGGCPLAEQHLLVVAADVACAALAQQLHHLVGEAELVDGVAGAHQLIDRAHAFERDAQGLVVAVDVGDDAEPHRF
jgi:hypothetical protein